MPDMIERMASIIGEKLYGHCTPKDTPHTWAMALSVARAAIAAMREPTEAMLVEGGAKHFGNDSMSVADFDEQATEIWKAMINAALKE